MRDNDWQKVGPVRDALQSRRSIHKYKKIPIDWDIIGELILAGGEAPTAGNLQARKFIVVTDQAKKKQLAEAAYQQFWIAEAPLVIVVVSEPEKLQRFYGVRGERLYSIQECAVAAENMIILAQAMGLGSCFVAAFDEEEVRSICSIPRFARPHILLTFGYAAEIPPEPPKYILRDLAHMSTYGGHIKDIENYMGLHWGRNIKKSIKGAGSLLQKGAEKVEDLVKKHITKKKESEDEKSSEDENKKQEYHHPHHYGKGPAPPHQ